MTAIATMLPFVGKWKIVDIQYTSEKRIPMPAESGAVFSEEEDGVHYNAYGIFPDGRRDMTAVFHVDGQPYPIKGSPAGDTLSFEQMDERTFHGTIRRAGVVTARTVVKVSADGNRTTTSWEMLTPDGSAITYTTTAARQQ